MNYMNYPLFRGLNETEVNEIINTKAIIKNFNENNILYNQNELVSCYSLVIEGSVDIIKITKTGKQINIRSLIPGDSFGGSVLFSNDKSYPFTIVSKSKVKLACIKKTELLDICHQHSTVLENFLKIITRNAKDLAILLSNYTHEPLRDKIIKFISLNGKNGILTIPRSKTHLANILGVSRTSLSRELKKMKDESLITYSRDYIKLL